MPARRIARLRPLVVDAFHALPDRRLLLFAALLLCYPALAGDPFWAATSTGGTRMEPTVAVGVDRILQASNSKLMHRAFLCSAGRHSTRRR